MNIAPGEVFILSIELLLHADHYTESGYELQMRIKKMKKDSPYRLIV